MGSTDMTGGVQDDERGVTSLARPAIGTGLEGVADFLAPLARADLRKNCQTDRMLLGSVGPVHCRQGRLVAIFGSIHDGVPAVVVGALEVREQPVERRLRGSLGLGHEV